jgi:hypothetical protein
VFSPVKSVALVWVLDPRTWCASDRMAHEAAMAVTIAY